MKAWRNKAHQLGLLWVSCFAGQTLSQAMPNGKLVFFPSHEQLNDAVAHWSRLLPAALSLHLASF